MKKKNNAFQFLNGLTYAGSLPKCALHAVHILKPKLHKVFNAVVVIGRTSSHQHQKQNVPNSFVYTNRFCHVATVS